MTGTRIGGTTVEDARAARYSSSILAGLAASQIAGLIMALSMTVAYRFGLQQGWLAPLQIIGTYLFGDSALSSPTVGQLLSALLFHQAVCAAWGLVFGLIAAPMRLDVTRAGVIALGVILGLASQIVDIEWITPALMNHFHGHNLWAENVPAIVSWVAHIVFGIGFIFFIPIFRSLWLRFAHREDLLIDDPRIT